jgi:hypothetical protein
MPHAERPAAPPLAAGCRRAARLTSDRLVRQWLRRLARSPRARQTNAKVLK